MSQVNRLVGFEGLIPALAARTVPAQEQASRWPARRTPVGAGLGRRLRALRHAFERRRERARRHQELARLDERLLRDVGLSRADLGVELEPPFLGLGEPLTGAHGERRRATLVEARVGLWHL